MLVTSYVIYRLHGITYFEIVHTYKNSTGQLSVLLGASQGMVRLVSLCTLKLDLLQTKRDVQSMTYILHDVHATKVARDR